MGDGAGGVRVTALTFVVPVRHQDNARDWPALKAKLAEAAASIANQAQGGWRGIVVANEGADLPGLPAGFTVVRVTFAPNERHELGGQTKEAFWDAFRIDKGRRVLAGMLAARDSRFFMVVDDDDLVSNRLVGHVAAHPDANGWTIDRGYVWDDGGRVLLGHDDFNHVCGTSLIVRSDLYGLPERFEDASPEWIRTTLGSHIQLADLLAERGTPLATLPFRGAVYRVAHGGSHSRTPSLLRRSFLSRAALRDPAEVARNVRRLRRVDAAARQEFFGERVRPGSPRGATS